MREVGIDISRETPKILTTDVVSRADVVITMGCGDTCPYFRGKRYLDWELTDPAGQDIDVVRQVRDDIKSRSQTLVNDLLTHAKPRTNRTVDACHANPVLGFATHCIGTSSVANDDATA